MAAASFEEPPADEVLQVAATRPALLLGLPMQLAVTLLVAAFAINNQAHSLLWGPAIAGPFWFLAAILVRRDYNGVRIFYIYLRNFTVRIGANRWGGATVSPFPRKPSRAFRGIR